ncbi:MAG: hypothetical protein V3V33_12540 [Candidatus Lokiarchaeia archaeon]
MSLEKIQQKREEIKTSREGLLDELDKLEDAKQEKKQQDKRRERERQDTKRKHEEYLFEKQIDQDNKNWLKSPEGESWKAREDAKERRKREQEDINAGIVTREQVEVKNMDAPTRNEYNDMINLGECTDVWEFQSIMRSREKQARAKRKKLKGLGWHK